MQTLATPFHGLGRWAKRHPVLAVVGALVVLGLLWWAWRAATAKAAPTRYVLGTVETGTIVSTVSASGQVSAKDSIDVKPQVSGNITWVGVTAGQQVHAGQALMTIDDTNARQALATAQKQLAADELTYQKSQAQAPIDYQNDQTALGTAQEDLATDYNSTYNDLTSTYLDFPSVLVQAQDTLYGYDFDPKKSQWNMDVLYNLFTQQTASEMANINSFKDDSVRDYNTANADYEAAVGVYKTTPRTASNADVDTLLAQSTTMATAVAQSLQSELNYLGAVSDLAQTYDIKLPSDFSTLQSDTRQSLATANSDLSALLNDKKELDQAKQAITTAQQNITLDQVGNPDGSNPISLQVSANSLAQEKQGIADQETNLADYTIVAPFDGTVATVDAQVGDSAGSAAVATVISQNEVATLSLNEVDAAKVKVGQKATLTFDAIDGLTLTGTVAEIDSVGTVSQGVVSYNVTIAFDTQNSQVKPGMTVNADIQTGVAQNTLVVPQSAVKTQGSQTYVLAFDPPLASSTVAAAGAGGVVADTPPAMVPVVEGLSDDTNVQIVSGLIEGQQIVVGTKSGTVTTAAKAQTGAAGFGGGGGARGFGGGGAVRIGG